MYIRVESQRRLGFLAATHRRMHWALLPLRSDMTFRLAVPVAFCHKCAPFNRE